MQPYDASSPFAASPAYAPPKPGAGPDRLQYGRAWSYAFESSQWALNLLFGTIVTFIPVIGYLLLYGYQFEIIESLHRDPRRTYPDFDFSRFADYLVRGVWVLLMSLFVAVVLMPVSLVLYVGGMIVVAATASAVGEEAAGIVVAVGFLLVALAIFVVTIPLTVAFTPLMIRAGLSQDLSVAFDFAWIKSFLAKTWKEIALGTLFLIVTSPLVVLLGAVFFCVGMYPAMVLVMLAQAHLYYQYYELFLRRGGEPVPLKDPQQGW
jgi:hypothetical protein